MPKNKKSYSRNNGRKFGKGGKNFKKPKKMLKADVDKKQRNYKFIKRSKEAEETQRRQKITEDKYRKANNVVKVDEMSEDEHEEENAFEQLVSCFQTEKSVQRKAIESSSDEDDEAEDDSQDEEGLDESCDDIDTVDDIQDEEDDSDDIIDDEMESVEDEVEIQSADEHLSEQSVDEEESGSEDGNDHNTDSENDSSTDGPTEPIIEEEEIDDEIERKESSKLPNDNDPFANHFEYELSQELLNSMKLKPIVSKKSNVSWSKLGNLQVDIPVSLCKEKIFNKNHKKIKKTLLDDYEMFAKEGQVPKLINSNHINLSNCQIKMQLQGNIIEANKNNIKPLEDGENLLTPLQCEIFSIINNYQDLFYPQRTLKNAGEIRFTYCLHALNHMLKTRTKILHHNAKISAMSKKKDNAILPDSYRDQGFVRPKVLIMLPFRDSAYKVVNQLISILFGNKSDEAKTNGSVINYKRFVEEYTGDTLYFPKTNPKPEDYEKTFCGNTDDTFRMGISLTKKCIKLYTEFYSSDILLASPLGLRMIVGAVGDSERDYDFLSSIELLILDQAELFLAQNWDHLLHVLDHLHLQPQSARNTDFARVRPWCLDGYSKFYRQTLLFTSHELAEFRSLLNNRCANYSGKVRVANPVVGGSIRHVAVQVPQVFHRIDVTSLESSFDKRFKYFITEILPQYKSPSYAHCMIYVPSYFDYVRLRNYFKSESINFVQICEYTQDGKIARARDMFFHSSAHFLLYSERAHFFRRTRIKGIRHLIMYQPPYWPNLYSELINFMQDGNQNPRDGLETSMTVTVLYSKYDMLQVSSIIGTDRAAKIFQSGKSTHMFMTGDS